MQLAKLGASVSPGYWRTKGGSTPSGLGGLVPETD